MGRYLVHRFFLSLISIFALITATFFLLRCLPGGPFDDDVHLAPQVLESLQAQYGLDQPLLAQYFLYVNHLAHFDLGHSILFSGQPVAEVVMRALPLSFSLGSSALLLGLIFGIGFSFLFLLTGSLSMVKVAHLASLSIPTLLLGPLMIYIFGLKLNWLPITVNEYWTSFILPVLVLSLRPTANLARLLIGALEESMAQPWAVTTQAYGFSWQKILMKFAFKQSLIPLLSYLGQTVAPILSGAILVEIIFNMNGLGSQFVESLVNRDYSVIIALTLMYGLILIVSNLFFDLIIFSLDPRLEKS